MKSRTLFAVLFTFVFAVILAGCGSSSNTKATSSAPTPVISTIAAPTAEATTNSVASGTDDPSTSAKGYFDALYSGTVVAQFMCSAPAASISTLTHYADSVTATLAASHAKFDVSGLTYETTNQSGNSANVNVAGKVTTTSAAGTSATSAFPSLTLVMKNESGWKICGLTTPS